MIDRRAFRETVGTVLQLQVVKRTKAALEAQGFRNPVIECTDGATHVKFRVIIFNESSRPVSGSDEVSWEDLASAFTPESSPESLEEIYEHLVTRLLLALTNGSDGRAASRFERVGQVVVVNKCERCGSRAAVKAVLCERCTAADITTMSFDD